MASPKLNLSSLKSAAIRFGTVFLGFVAFELTKNGQTVNAHTVGAALLAAVPLAIEKYVFPSGP